MKVLLLGSGGRESALAWALSRSSQVDQLYVAPGNPGIAELSETVACDVEDPRAVCALARRVGADLVAVGPEAPLVRGVADAVGELGIPVFGPSAAAARLEGSKSYAKQLMERAQVPTAAWRAFTDPAPALAYLDELGPPYVIKADGLAAGKGVVVTEDRDEAIRALEERLVEGRFGAAGSTVVIEEFLDGEEASLIAFTDGAAIATCEPAQDYKRVGEGDTGPNTMNPCARRASPTPATKGASGPTTTRPGLMRFASAVTASTSDGSNSCRSARPAMPGFPGAATRSLTKLDLDSAHASALSRPPDPRSRALNPCPARLPSGRGPARPKPTRSGFRRVPREHRGTRALPSGGHRAREPTRCLPSTRVALRRPACTC